MADYFVNDDVLDAALSEVKDNATFQHLCSQDPTSYAEVGTYSLANGSVTGTDFSIQNGDTSGRKLSIAEKTNGTITANGDGTYIAIVDGSRLLSVKPTTSTVSVTTSGTATFEARDVMEISDAGAA